MRKFFNTTLGIYDTATNIKLYELAVDELAELSIHRIEAGIIPSFVENFVIATLSKPRWCKVYGITATQFDALLEDRRIEPFDDYVIRVEQTEECLLRSNNLRKYGRLRLIRLS